jgi:glycosyltransferase involved in cell wall biosynthesis
MNVGVVVPGFSADAADWCIPALRHFARGLATHADVRVLALRYPYRADRYVLDGAEVIALGGADRRGVGVLSVWRRTLSTLASEHRRRRFDVLHAFWATESGLLTALAGRLLGVPTLVSLAGGELVALPDIGYGDQRSAWERLKIGAALRLASAISVGSAYLGRIAEQHVRRRGPIRQLPLGVDVDLFLPADRPCIEGRLLHVGTLTPVKDQRTLLAAFAELRRRQPTVTLDVVGDGPLRAELARAAHELRISDAVRFLGERDHGQLVPLYQAARAFVLSSRHEAQCMVALEAASCGLPVVGTCVGVVPELAPHTAVEVANAHALADALELSLAVPSDRGQVRQLVERQFALEPCVQGFLQCYGQLAA